MRQTLLFLLFLFFQLNNLSLSADHEHPLPLAISDGAPSAMVNGMVDAITGTYGETEVDMVIPGPTPIVVSRSYSSAAEFTGGMGYGWDWNLPSRATYVGHRKNKRIYMDESSGATFVYPKVKGGAGVFALNPSENNKGLTNSGSGILSGRTNIKNAKLVYREKPDEIDVVMGDGETRHFTRATWRKDSDVLYSLFLINRRLPEGNYFHYTYGSFKGLCAAKMVVVTNKIRDITFGSFNVEARKDCDKLSISRLISGDGRDVKYSCSFKSFLWIQEEKQILIFNMFNALILLQ